MREPSLRGRALGAPLRCGAQIRSSATAEDLPTASFAGQQESYLNVAADALLPTVRRVMASLYTDRRAAPSHHRAAGAASGRGGAPRSAISYRLHQGFAHDAVAISVGVQLMVRADQSAAGVIFSIDTNSGHPSFVLVNGSWGLGENVVGGSVVPDEWLLFKPTARFLPPRRTFQAQTTRF